MAFTIPNVSAAFHALQARIQSGDLQILTDALNEVGVVSGCAVTAQGSPNMTVAIASGTVRIGGANVSVTSGNVTVSANASGSPRLDLICVNASGTKSCQAGTAAASPNYPAIPASSVVLAMVYVPNSLSAVTTNHIVDKRAIVIAGADSGVRTVRTPEASGAVGNAVTVFDAAVTASDATLTSATSTFTGRAGQVIYVAGAGAAGATLATTILSVTNATTIELNTNASTTVTAAECTYGTNDTSALNTWLALGSSTTELRATAGVRYLHTGVVSMTGKDNVLLDLRNAEFVATVQTASAFKVDNCDNLQAYGGIFSLAPAPTSRGSSDDHNGLHIEGCARLRWEGPQVRRAHAAGIMVATCTDGEIIDATVRDSKADGFHMTGGTAYFKVVRPVTVNTGDDGVAVVSYNTGEAISHDIEVISPDVRYQTSGRGLTVLGGRNITFTDISVYRSAGAAIYIAIEDFWDSFPTTNVRVTGGFVALANQDTSLDHGAVYIYNTINGAALTDVLVEGLDIRDTRPSAGGSLLLKNSGSTGTMSRIFFTNLRLVGDRPETDYGADGGLSATRTNITHGEGVHQANWKDTDYTLALTDAGDRILCASSSARAITVPPNASVAFPKHTTVSVVRMGSGAVTITAGAGVTLRYKDGQTGNRAIQGQYGAVELWQAEANEWIVLGDVDSAIPGGELAEIMVALSDETTTITTGTAKLTMRMPFAMQVNEVRANVNTVSSSGPVTVDINEGGTTILSTKLSIDQGEKTSTTAATPAVISDDVLNDDAEVTFDIDAAGTGAKGLKVTLVGERTEDEVPPVDFLPRTPTSLAYSTRTTTTLTKPTGTLDGDIILLGIVNGASSPGPDAPTPPAGFTLITGLPTLGTHGGFEVEIRVYYKVASSEPSTWDFTHTSNSSQGFAIAIPGGNTGTPIDVNASVNAGVSSTTTATGVTTVTNGAMVFFVAQDWGNTANNLVAPTASGVTFTELVEVNPLMYVAYGIKATAGATGNASMTNNAGGEGWSATLFAVRPA